MREASSVGESFRGGMTSKDSEIDAVDWFERWRCNRFRAKDTVFDAHSSPLFLQSKGLDMSGRNKSETIPPKAQRRTNSPVANFFKAKKERAKSCSKLGEICVDDHLGETDSEVLKVLNATNRSNPQLVSTQWRRQREMRECTVWLESGGEKQTKKN